jgi:hypothetical protein
MAAKLPVPIRDKDLKGLKYFKLLGPLFDRLHDDATARDRAGNRRLFYDQYASVLLLSFFNPVLKSLRSLQAASKLDKVQRRFRCHGVSRASLSEASRVFDPELLRSIIADIAAQTLPRVHGKEAEALRGLTAVDGSLLPALPKMVWALWQDNRHRAAKMHVHFDVLKGVPTDVRVTAANDSERDQLRASLQPGGFYVLDRGYRDWAFFQEIVTAGASFVARVQANTVIHAAEERPVTAAARAAGVVRDVVIDRTGSNRQRRQHPLRILVIDTGQRLRNGKPELLILCTNRLDLAAELVALAYRFRWAVENCQPNCTSSVICCRTRFVGYDPGSGVAPIGPLGRATPRRFNRRNRMSDQARSSAPPRADRRRRRLTRRVRSGGAYHASAGRNFIICSGR